MRRRSLLLMSLVLVVASSCSTIPSWTATARPIPPHTATTPAPTARRSPPTTIPASSDARPGTQTAPPTIGTAALPTPEPVSGSTALRTEGELEVFPHPYATVPSRTLPAATVLGTPTVVLVKEERNDGWVRVALPGRPNGAEGWVHTDGLVEVTTTREVEVDLGDRVLRVMESGEEIYSTPVAIGSTASPTPAGSFFITDAVALIDESGPWGPFAFGLSARSDAITEFKGADGIIGIHGTNDPSSIGHAASLGCVRVPNDVIRELWRMLSVGIPVSITA